MKKFFIKLADQVEYIAKDKPKATRKFKVDVLKAITNIADSPYSNKKSIYLEDSTIRDLTFKGYTIVYRIKEKEQIIEVFGFIKYRERL